jgi:predicted Zn finger-like uncharacterized protein
MHIENVNCPACGAQVMVDHKLWSVGTIRLRCGACSHYFLPKGSPKNMSIDEAANAGVPITLWEPPEAK